MKKNSQFKACLTRNISSKIIPNDQTSTFGPETDELRLASPVPRCGFCDNISGAMYFGFLEGYEFRNKIL